MAHPYAGARVLRCTGVHFGLTGQPQIWHQTLGPH